MTQKKILSAFAMANRIPTTKGWKHVGELTLNDYVFDINGKPTRIKRLVQHNVLAMRIRLADGREYTCSEYAELPGNMVTHEAMKYLQVYRDRGKLPQSFHKPANGPAIYPHKPVPIEPYLVGLLASKNTVVTQDYILAPGVIRESASTLNTGHVMDERALVIPFERNRQAIAKLKEIYHGGLDYMTKYIADEYMTNDIPTRMDLLAGIIDIAGRPLVGCCKLRNLSSSMRMDVRTLANSLGIMVVETGADELKLFSNKLPSRRSCYQTKIENIQPSEVATHPIIRKIKCNGFAKSLKIEVYSDTPSILLEEYIPVLI